MDISVGLGSRCADFFFTGQHATARGSEAAAKVLVESWDEVTS